MSAQALPVHASTLCSKAETNRRSANYHASIWGDLFLSPGSDFTSTDHNIEQQAEILKEKVRSMLMATVDKPSQKLNFIDAIQRLGVSYHFESEIDEVLQEMHKTRLDNDEDLHTVALQFRLLRQQGYYVSCDIFNKFKDTEGNFKKCLNSDGKGMLSLYEATHLRVHGEDILDEALAFTTTNLESMVTHLSSPLAEQVSRALNRPMRRSLPRLEAYYYISIYPKDPSHDKVLLMFAKLDFNLLQKIHRKELSVISKWWKDLDFATKLPFARDRVVECYFWILGVYFEPQYALARNITVKVISMTSIIDDTYDVYGTLEELEQFTNAIDRWDISCIDTLPEYMKHIYKALLDVYAEVEEEMSKQGRSYCVHYVKQAMKNQVQAYFVEAKWFNDAYVPTMEEYMPVALVSCGYYMLSTTCFIGMGEIVTKEIVDWVFNHPKIVRAASMVNRLMDDIVSNKFEQERGHVASGIECYMKQHGVSEQFVIDDFNRQVVDAWKDINQEFLRPTEVPMAFLMRVLNFSRVMEVLYKTGDGYTHVGEATKSYIASLLINPLEI